MTWWLIVAAVFLVVRRVFRPRIVVMSTDDVTTATVVSVWSRREYVQSQDQSDPFPFGERYHVWRDTSSGAAASMLLCRRIEEACFAYDHAQAAFKRATRDVR